jgi:hypothetical protein
VTPDPIKNDPIIKQPFIKSAMKWTIVPEEMDPMKLKSLGFH